MKQNKILTASILIAVLIISTVGFFYLRNLNKGNISGTDTLKQPSVKVFILKPTNPDIRIKQPGEIVPDKKAELYAKVTGFVRTLHTDIGSRVKQGDILVQLEAPELSAKVLSLKAQVTSQQAIVSQSNANYKRLLAASATSGAVSEDALEEAFNRKESDEARLKALQASYEECKSLEDYLVIRAPFSGIITERNADVGMLAVPSSKPLLVLQDDMNLRLRFTVPDKYAGYVHLKDSISFTVNSVQSTTYGTEITRSAGAFDSKLRSITFEADIKNEQSGLLPGMVTDVIIPLISRENSFFVPKSSVVNGNMGTYVMAIIDGKTKKIDVRTGRNGGMKIEIIGKLNEDMKLVEVLTEEMKEGLSI